MTEEVVEQPNTVSEGESVKELSIEDLQAKLDELAEKTSIQESYIGKLKEESKANASKYKSLRDNVEEQEIIKMQAQNDYKGMVQKREAQIAELQSKLAKKEELAMETKYMSEVQRYAGDAYDFEDVANALDSSMLKIDKEEGNIFGVKEAVEELKTRKAHLFKQLQSPTMISSKPGVDKPKPFKDKLKEMSAQEIKELAIQKFG